MSNFWFELALLSIIALASAIRPMALTAYSVSLNSLLIKTTTTNKGNCPSLSQPDSFQNPDSVDDFRESIREYLNEGCSPKQVYSALSNQEWIQVDYSLADFDGDSNWDVIFSASVYTGGDGNIKVGPEGVVFSYKFEDGDWIASTLYQDWFIQRINIVTIQNLIGSSSPELVIRYYWRGSGHIEGVHIYQWSDTWEEIEFEKPQLGLRAYDPGYMEIGLKVDFIDEDLDNDKEIYISSLTGPGYYRHGGVGRRIVLIYDWNGHAYQPKNYMFLPSPYRIHLLEDAQSVFNAGNLFESAHYYRQAANDDLLLDELSVEEASEIQLNNATQEEMEKVAHAYQTAFAHFRLATIWLHLGYDERAQREIDNLENLFPDGSPGSEFLDIALYFQRQMVSGSDSYQSCEAVTQHIEQNYPLLASHFFWGDRNVYYFKDFCPFNKSGG